jgi:RNA polymerase sigma factor (sigma-70 family)
MVGQLGTIVQQIRRLAGGKEAAPTDDTELLRRFLSHRDQAAFESLLNRHGPMVFGVCKRVLYDLQDAEDAFQATFLVLMRKAHSLGRPERLANWLYGVAYRTALKARSARTRRHMHERAAMKTASVTPPSAPVWNDIRPILDDELNRLPEKYRLPVVLCYLEGQTFSEAARRLGWPAGTVSGRLARAREILQRRLTRRGVTVSVSVLTAFLTADSLSASVPHSLAISTLRAALIIACGKAAGALTAPVFDLMEGVLHAMGWSKLKLVTLATLALGILGAGTGFVAQQRLSAQQDKVQKTAPAKIQEVPPAPPFGGRMDWPIGNETDPRPPVLSEEKADEVLAASRFNKQLKALLKERFDAARAEVVVRCKEFIAGRGTLDILCGASRRMLEAEQGLSDKDDDQIAAWERHRKRMKQIEEVNEARFQAGRIGIQDLAQVRYFRADAEIGLERATTRAGKRLGD